MAPQRPLTKNEKKRLKKKAAKLSKGDTENKSEEKEEWAPPLPDEPEPEVKVEVEYVSADVEVDPGMEEFKEIFQKFASAEEVTGKVGSEESKEDGENDDTDKSNNADKENRGEEENEEGGGSGQQQLGRKARKKASRLSVAELKQLVARPDVVEAHDVTSADPRLLVFLKSYRNTVPVPRHWCHKRKYLQGKRGIEKPPFQLPEFIGATGIEKIRSSIIEAEAAQSAKQKGRSRVAPKMGKIDIDYQVLHDAFFKYQKKPHLSHHGDIYYEGKEFEVKLRSKTPGMLSSELRQALAIPDGAPPPWLINMQRYGPPPAYPNLKIPGLNAPIPQGAKFGFQPGEWGKPPVDEYGRPLYGDVFAAPEDSEGNLVGGEVVDRTLWGELGSESEASESEEEEEEEEEEEGEEEDMSGLDTPSGESMISGMTSVTSGMDTPDTHVDLRKRQFGTETPDTSIPEAPKTLYQVLPEQQSTIGNAGFFGADKSYSLPGQAAEDLSGLSSEASEAIIKKSGNDVDEDDLEEQHKRKRKAEKEKQAKKKKPSDNFKF